MIERQNILNLLGTGKKKYHSCIITCYSFDFLFFEHRVLSILRNAGISNVNVYVDASMLEKTLSETLTNNLIGKKSYSLTPIQMKGAFHPKILLAIGKKEGLLAIGSGNLTASGLNSNEEIWGVFHIDQKDTRCLPIFKQASEYLENLNNYGRGVNQKKSKWLHLQSEWYNQLLRSDIQKEEIQREGESIGLVSSFGEHSIYRQLIEAFPDGANEIKILSPYYNRNGSLISNLVNDLAPKSIHCIVDPKWGTVPYNLKTEKQIDFSEWDKLEVINRKDKARLHAKAIQIRNKQHSVFLFGSPNATTEALGDELNNSKNAEMAILIKNADGKDFFEELGIQIPVIGNCDLGALERSTIDKNENRYLAHPFVIEHAELDSSTLYIFLRDTEYSQSLQLKILDPSNECEKEFPIDEIKPIIKMELDEEPNLKFFKVALYSEAERVSNYAFLHHIELIKKTNPDDKLIRINELLNKEDFDDPDLEELLQYTNFNIISKVNSTYTKRKKPDSQEGQGQESKEAIPEEEFNLGADLADNSRGIGYSSNSMVEEVLNQKASGIIIQSEDVSDSEERVSEEAGDEGTTDSSLHNVIKVPSFNAGDRLKKRIKKTLQRITKTISTLEQAPLNKSKKNNELSPFECLYLLLIGCHSIVFKAGEQFTEDRNQLRIFIKRPSIKNRNLDLLERKYRLHREHVRTDDRYRVFYSIHSKNSVEIKKDLNYQDSFSQYDYKLINNFTLEYIDETPSKKLFHSYIDDLDWKGSELAGKYTGLDDFFINGICTFLNFKSKLTDVFDGSELIKWRFYNRRLLYRISLILMMYKWNKKNSYIRDLILLNSFYFLCKEPVPPSEFREKLIKPMGEDRFHSLIIPSNYGEIMRLYQAYYKWHQLFTSNTKSLKKPMSESRIGSIVFRKSSGFGVIRHIKDPLVDIETPLGTFDSNSKFFGLKEQFIGTSPKFFNPNDYV